MGDKQAECILNETGVNGKFGPLHKTGFGTSNGWNKRGGSIPPESLRAREQRSANMDNVEKFRKTNENL